MICVIKKASEDRYRTRPSAPQPYTMRLDRAHTFTSKEQARRRLCPGPEVVVDVSVYLR
jgi:hypothetical protein